MNCASCNAELPAGARFCPRCAAPVAVPPGRIDTGGGGVVFGSMQAGRDVVMRDKIVQGDESQTIGLRAEDLTKLSQAVEAYAAAHPTAQTAAVRETASSIEQEAAKGEEADPDRITDLLGTLGRLAPDILEVAVNALTNPGAAVASGIKLVARAFKEAAARRGDG